MHDLRQLNIYEKSLAIAEVTYALTKTLSRSDRWNLGQQMNRSALSVVSNIAEGAGRGDDRDFARFLRIARGSAAELDAQVELGERLTLFDPEATADLKDAIDYVKASISKLDRRLRHS